MKNKSNLPIIDTFGRVHTNLRLSITDRCNIRCFYCMPVNVQFLPRTELLNYEEMVRIVRLLTPAGLDKIRITGGEPLVRKDVDQLIRQLVSIDGILDVALTTNGLLLDQMAASLKQAGLHRLNISLDALNPEVFEKITRRSGLEKVLAGIETAQQVGFTNIRINAVSIRGMSETEIIPLTKFCRQRNLTLRFIEYMPLDADRNWDLTQVLSGADLRRVIEAEWGPLTPVQRKDPSQPAVDFAFENGPGKIGFINSVSQPFCSECNRMRLTADGKFRNCLFSAEDWDLRGPLRAGASDHEILEIIRHSIAVKKPGHGIDDVDFMPPQRAMYQIGG